MSALACRTHARPDLDIRHDIPHLFLRKAVQDKQSNPKAKDGT